MIFIFPEKYLYKQNGDKFTFELGGYYTNSNATRICQFIKTSNKGYNFVDIKNGRCVFTKPLFSTNVEHHNRHITFSMNRRYVAWRNKSLSLMRPLDKDIELIDILRNIKKNKWCN